MFDFEGQFSLEDEEELTRVKVGVACLAGAGRHELFDDAEFGSFYEMPAVAVGCLRASPFVVFGGFCADDLSWHPATYRRHYFLSNQLRTVEAEEDGQTEIDHEEDVNADVKQIRARIVAAQRKDVTSAVIHLPILVLLLFTRSE